MSQSLLFRTMPAVVVGCVCQSRIMKLLTYYSSNYQTASLLGYGASNVCVARFLCENCASLTDLELR